jgi:hypothetical protein
MANTYVEIGLKRKRAMGPRRVTTMPLNPESYHVLCTPLYTPKALVPESLNQRNTQSPICL